MKYAELEFRFTPFEETYAEVLAAMLAEVGFDSFEPGENVLKAYVPCQTYSEDAVKDVVRDFFIPDVQIEYSVSEIESQDWNVEWEREGFEPIIIDDLCVIHASYHEGLPHCKYDITINPRMAFGTGSHETTALLTQLLLNADLSGKHVLDMGCGTGILSIAMSLRGADRCVAIDIDEDSVVNAKYNCSLNALDNVEVLHGDANMLSDSKFLRVFDVVVANIHKNIILSDMSLYVDTMRQGGSLFVSGFYTSDIPEIKTCAETLGLVLTGQYSKNDWAVLLFEKIS